jgi:hypothetical protein
MKPSLIITFCGLIYVFFYLSVFGLSQLSFILGSQITHLVVYISVVISFLLTCLCFRLITGVWSSVGFSLIPLISLCFIIGYGVAVNQNIYDLSYDGQSYQGEAVASIIEGWNPIQNSTAQNLNQYTTDANHSPILSSQPKAMWYNAAAIYRVTENFQDIKYASTSVLIALFFVVLGTLLQFNFSKNTFVDTTIKSSISILTVCNPIALMLATSLSPFGLMYGFTAMLLCSIVLQHISKYKQNSDKLGFAISSISCAIILINISPIGLVIALSLLITYTIFNLFITRSNAWVSLIVLISTAVLGIGIFGYQPYITSYQESSNFSTVFEKDYALSNVQHIPSNYQKTHPMQRFVESIFFKTDNIFLYGKGESAELKLPFTIFESELDAITTPELKKGGFGPLFSGVLILSLLAVGIGLAYNYKQLMDHNPYIHGKVNASRLTPFLITMLISLVLLGTMVWIPSLTVARFVPQFWLVMCLWVLYSFSSHSSWARIVASIALVAGMINSGFLLYSFATFQIERSKDVTNRLEEWSTSGDTYELNFGEQTSLRRTLIDNNIPFKYSKEVVDCPVFRDDLLVAIDDTYTTVYGCLSWK